MSIGDFVVLLGDVRDSIPTEDETTEDMELSPLEREHYFLTLTKNVVATHYIDSIIDGLLEEDHKEGTNGPSV